MELRGKTIIITGVARIGQDIVKALKEKGVNLVIGYFNDEKEAELGFGVQCDVSKEDSIVRLVREAKNKFGSVDGLIHMAAIYEKSEFENLDEKQWQKNMDIIARSSYLIGKIAGDEMLKNGGDVKGKMIFFSDWSVLARPYKEYIAYNAAKAAVVSLTKSFAKALAPGILVNAIAPGPMLKPPNLNDKENEEVLANTLLKRWGGADEITKGVMYLLEADFVTGAVLTIDGGRTIA